MSASKIKVKRTGKTFSIASSEYEVTFPDGTKQTIWSPPWNDYSPRKETAEALKYAADLWAQKLAASPAATTGEGERR